MRAETYETQPVVKFNWELLKKYTECNVHKMLEFFDNVYVRKSENYFYLNPWAARIVAESKDNAHNYIQNIPALLIAAKGATDSEIFVYLDLVSKRPYFNFVNTKGKANYLPIWKVDNYDINTLKMNRLLEIGERNIKMLYEGDV